MENEKKVITVFVTYSWDNPEHEEKVHAFTNFLRDNGFHAEVDKMLIQSETAKDFKIMMHRGMTDYKKVIVILSKGYKEKAEKFKGGVGTEYTLILKDIEENPGKYILVSFSGRDSSSVPLFFRFREIIDLSNDNEEEKRKLFSKLLDVGMYQFNEVASSLPEVTPLKVVSMFSKGEVPGSEDIEIQDLSISQDNAQYLFGKLKFIELNAKVSFKNVSLNPLNEYTVEIYYPLQIVSYEVDGRIEEEYKVITVENTNKVFPQQIKTINLEKLHFRNNSIQGVLNKSIIVKIYTEKGVFKREFPLSELVIKNHMSHLSEKLNKDLFLEGNY